MLARVLVPVDGSPHANAAAQLAATLVGPTGEVTLLHVSPDVRGAAALVDSVTAIVGGSMGDLRERQAFVESEVGTRILMETSRTISTPVQLRTEVQLGRPAHVVLDLAEQRPFDAIVIGPRGRGTLARAILGSVSDSVLRHAPKTVLLTRHPSVTSMLVAVDGSPASKRALDECVALGERLNVPVNLLYVAEMNWEAPREAREAERANERMQYLEYLAGLSSSMSIRERLVAFGDPTEQILKVTASQQATLVALGRTGRTPHPRVSLGSVASRVASQSDASVLIVP